MGRAGSRPRVPYSTPRRCDGPSDHGRPAGRPQVRRWHRGVLQPGQAASDGRRRRSRRVPRRRRPPGRGQIEAWVPRSVINLGGPDARPAATSAVPSRAASVAAATSSPTNSSTANRGRAASPASGSAPGKQGAVQTLAGRRAATGESRDQVGGSARSSNPRTSRHLGAGQRHQRDRGAEQDHAGALRADEGTGQVEAVSPGAGGAGRIRRPDGGTGRVPVRTTVW